MKLLICEDELDLLDALEAIFVKNNYIVDKADNGEDGYLLAQSGTYDGIIMDIMMPKMDGLTVLNNLRERGIDTPIMLLTAKGETSDRITGFKMGADDYLPKPFDIDELLIRVKAMLRRSGNLKSDVITYEDIKFDKDKAIIYCEEKQCNLNGKEYQLFELFITNPGKVFSSEYLMEKIWGYSDADISVVWVHISNIRKKLKQIGSKLSILSNRGLGYFLGTK